VAALLAPARSFGLSIFVSFVSFVPFVVAASWLQLRGKNHPMNRRRIMALGAIAIALVVVFGVLQRDDEAPGATRQPRRPSRAERLRQSLFELLQPSALANCTLARYGEPHDGGYLVCANLLDRVEAGYSYGISGYDGWGCDVSRNLKVAVHEYDCFDTRQPACPDGKLVFHPECVGFSMTDEDGRPFDTIANQIAKNRHTGKRLVVKMDVEGAEWDSFILAPDAVFEQIDQLVVEFHGVESDRYIAALQRLRQFFHVANLHFNNYSCDPALKPFPASAYEVLFVNKRLAEADSSRTPERPHPLDAPNNPNAPDCQF
jgi:hypothetical protein